MAKEGGQKSIKEEIKEPFHKTKIKVIGIGGGGGNIISEIASKLPKVSFVAVNTDLQALKKVGKKVFRFQFGQNFTEGLGTGMNTEIAQEAAFQEKERIKKLLSGYDFCIIIASLGGGAGSGASPIFAKIAKNLGLITLGIFTLPFKFEGEKKMDIAREALLKLRPNLNTFIILPNERIFQAIDKNTPLQGALSAINKNLAESLTGLIETIYQPGLINIDFADFKTILEGRGKLGFLNTVLIEKEKEKIEVIKKVIESPLYPYGIEGAKGILLNIASEKNLSLSDISQISKTISQLSSPEAKIIFGISQHKNYQNEIKVTLLATGCATKIFSEKKIKPRRRTFGSLRGKKRPTKILPEAETPKIQPKEKKKRKVKIRKKIKVKVMSEPKEKEVSQPEMKEEEKVEAKIRKNGLQIRKETEEVEKELLEKEKIWETPAFLRKTR